MAANKPVPDDLKSQASESKFSRYKELAAILSLASAVFFGFLLWAPPSLGGVLGRAVRGVGHGLFGTIAALLPFLLLYFAGELYLEREEKVSTTRRICIFLFFLTIATIISAFSLDIDRVYLNTRTNGISSVWSSLELLWNSGTDPAAVSDSPVWNGGILGGFIYMGLEHVVGKTGSLILLTGMLLALPVVVFDLSWKKAISKTADVVMQTGIKVDEARKNYLEKQRLMKEERNLNHKEDLTAGVSALKDEFEPDQETRKLFAQPSFLRRKKTQTPEPEKEKETIETYEPELPLSFPEGDWSAEAEGSEAEPGWKPLDETPFELTAGERPEESRQRSVPPLPEPPAAVSGNGGIRSVFIPLKQEYLLHDLAQAAAAGAPLPDGPKDAGRPQESELAEIAGKIVESDEAIPHESDREKWQDRSAGKRESSTVRIKSSQEQKLPYAPPPIHLLNQEKNTNRSDSDKEEIRLLGAKLEKTLKDFGVDAEVINFITGPTISRFELRPGPGVKVSKIVNLSDDIALALAATGLRIEAPIPGKSAIGIEIPNKNTKAVLLRGLIESEAFRKHKSPLAAVLGRDIQGGEMICDIAAMPHLLIAGATGSGKSVCINSILISLLYRSSPDDLRLLMIDPKVVELSIYNKIPHLLQPVVTEPKKAYGVLDWAVQEMNRRYTLFADAAVRDFKSYNEVVEKNQIEGSRLPLILLVIDELSDLMATTPTEVENAISRLTAMARAAGIHLIIATQRPSVDVITGVIKANIPSRVAFSVASQVDSRTILDMGGAEKLLGKGDMLYYPQSASKPLRGQGAFVTDAEVERVIDYLRKNYSHDYNEEVGRAIELAATSDDEKNKSKDSLPEEDELLMDALRTVVETGYASVSLLQRRLTVGYPRAARMIDCLHEKNWIGPHEGSKPRKVLITAAEFEPIFEEYEKEKLNRTT